MVSQLLMTLAVISLLMAGWLGLQAWSRRFNNLSSECDALEGRIGCFGCALSGKCRSMADEPNHRRQYPGSKRPE